MEVRCSSGKRSQVRVARAWCSRLSTSTSTGTVTRSRNRDAALMLEGLPLGVLWRGRSAALAEETDNPRRPRGRRPASGCTAIAIATLSRRRGRLIAASMAGVVVPMSMRVTWGLLPDRHRGPASRRERAAAAKPDNTVLGRMLVLVVVVGHIAACRAAAEVRGTAAALESVMRGHERGGGAALMLVLVLVLVVLGGG
jgi:hypothetical protein